MKCHFELQREITLIELVPSLHLFIKSICLVDINMFTRFDEIPTISLQDIKETKRYGWNACHLELQREITLIELVPGPYFFI